MSFRKAFVLALLALLAASLFVAGCSSQGGTSDGEDTGGKPAMLFFWQPG